MKKILFLFFAGFFFTKALSQNVSDADQLIVVVSKSWNDNHALLLRFEKTGGKWKQLSPGDSVSIGKTGLAWGIGLHRSLSDGPVKKEGDKKSPAGIFELGYSYGWAEKAPEGVTYPYKNITELSRCVDDPNSKAYNSILEETSSKDWNSAERMKIIDYKLLIVVNHNPEHLPGKGSCIFLHLNNTPTVGCTAMNDSTMLSLLTWLSPKKKVLLVQLPREVYHQVQTQWHLPVIH
ncbi:MAG: hypothetical protein H3C35_08345 [Bacteroidetes bacterium]|nr:hypothetical protein [Bacteroidota bacterium]